MDDTATTIGSNSAGRALIFQTNNADRLYINGNTGNVGIGTTDPGRPLSINSDTAHRAIRILENDSANESWDIGVDVDGDLNFFNSADTSPTVSFLDTGNATFAGNVTIGDNSASEIFLAFNSSATDFALGANGSNFMIGTSSDLDSGNLITLSGTNGRLGIGTTSPGTALQVGGLDDGSNYDITVGWNAVSSQAVGTKRSALTFKTSQTGVNNEDIYKWDIAMVTAPATASSEPFGSDLAFLRSTRSSTSVNETTMILTQLGNVGIGTTTPNEKLQLAGNLNAYAPGGIDAGLFASTAAGSTTIALRSNGVTHFNGGNVGIGTTGPGAKLDVKTAIAPFTALKVSNYGTNVNALYAGAIDDTYLYFGSGFYYNSSKFRAPSTTAAITSYDSGVFRVFTNSGLTANTDYTPTERMRITSTGNVGIGTTSPGAKLEVRSDGSAAGGAEIRLQHANNNTNDVVSTVNFANNAGSVGMIQAGTAGANNTGYIALFTDIAGSSSERMRVHTNGNVGIGTTSPDSKLHVAGGTRLGGGGCYISTDASFSTNFSYTFRDAVGINNPNSVSAPSVAGYVMSVGRSISGGVGGGIYVEGESRFARGLAGAIKFNAYDSTNNTGTPTYLLGTDASGNVVKTTTVPGSGAGPYLPLSAGSSYPLTGDLYLATASNEGNLFFGTSSASYKIFGGGTYGYMGYDTGGYHRFLTSGSEKMRIDSSGNVGIGTTNPTNKLHIQGSQTTVYSPTDSGGQASAGTTINNTNTAGNTNNFSQLLFTVGTNNNSVSRIVAIRSGSDASDLAFVGKSTAGVAEYMRIKSGGNVGIGIDNPSALLEVRKGTISGQIAKFSAINPHVVIESSTAGNAVLHLKPNVTGTKSGQFKVTAGNGYNFRWSNDASGTGEIAYMDLDTSTTGGGDLTVKGDVIAYGSPSDRKYKENIKPIESALDKAMQLQGVTFDWKDSESILEIKEDIGFIAQDVQEVLPELVRDNGKGNLSLRYQGITPILLEAIKELKAEIEELKLNNCNCNK
jgi:hypothetical protein